ncbi:unnamed protein product, partial [Owenia fusiformis]
GNLACRYTWPSVLKYDDDYRKKQNVYMFRWGTDTPHLSEVHLERRPPKNDFNKPSNAIGKKKTSTWSSNRVLYCDQWNNKGTCSYGDTCKFAHKCKTCNKSEHHGKDHP